MADTGAVMAAPFIDFPRDSWRDILRDRRRSFAVFSSTTSPSAARATRTRQEVAGARVLTGAGSSVQTLLKSQPMTMSAMRSGAV